MKILLTPKLAYLIGIWKYRRSKEGLGVIGSDQLCAAFVSSLIECGIAKPEEVKAEEGKAYTYHSAYRAFCEQTLMREADAFKYKNEYAASFFAGLYDAVGGERRGVVYFAKADNSDEMALLRMNWNVVRRGKAIGLVQSDEFMAWIEPYRKVEIPKEAPTPENMKQEPPKVERKRRRTYPLPPPRV